MFAIPQIIEMQYITYASKHDLMNEKPDLKIYVLLISIKAFVLSNQILNNTVLQKSYRSLLCSKWIIFKHSKERQPNIQYTII